MPNETLLTKGPPPWVHRDGLPLPPPLRHPRLRFPRRRLPPLVPWRIAVRAHDYSQLLVNAMLRLHRTVTDRLLFATDGKTQNKHMHTYNGL
jgi:hypothetical protein